MERITVGTVTHFYPRISVAVIELSGELKIGDRIAIEGPTTKIEQVVESMQIEHASVESAGAGQKIGLKTVARVREGDIVYKLP